MKTITNLLLIIFLSFSILSALRVGLFIFEHSTGEAIINFSDDTGAFWTPLLLKVCGISFLFTIVAYAIKRKLK